MTQLIRLFGENSSSLVRMKVVKNRMRMSLLCMLRGTQIYQQFKNNVVEVVIHQKISSKFQDVFRAYPSFPSSERFVVSGPAVSKKELL